MIKKIVSKLLILLFLYVIYTELLHSIYPNHLPALPKLSQWLPISNSGLNSLNRETVYKWKDKTGQWIYSTLPPAKNQPSEKLEIDPETSILPSKKSP